MELSQLFTVCVLLVRSEGADFPYGEVFFVFQAHLGLDERNERWIWK